MRVAIIGAGPAGAAQGILLAREGAEVTLFDDGRRPELLVGESLIPAVIPIFKRLGIEDTMATCGRLKPGVSFVWSESERFSFTFARFAPAVPPYAYNIARPQFDEAVRARALAAGVHHVIARARLVPAGTGSAELALDAETLAAAPMLGGRQPDFIVDATGRGRLAAGALRIPARVGPRNDVAHFAHFEDFKWDDVPGQVLISRLKAGWSWGIPLKERLSVGIVLGRDDAAGLGATPLERLERAIAIDPWLTSMVGAAKRVTSVATYSNYQLISERGAGPGWVTIGDAFGFVDPMLSPGVFLALRSAEVVADAVTPFLRRRATPSPDELYAALRPYAAKQQRMLAAWLDLIAHFYDGRMLALMRSGRNWIDEGPNAFKNAAQNHIERHIALQAAGVGTTSRYSRALLRVLARYGMRGVTSAEMAIH